MKKIAVLFGGCSSEYKVSLQSAYAVLSHINREKYEPVLVGITPDGNWYLYQGDWEKIPKDQWYAKEDCKPVVVLPDHKLHGLMVYGKKEPEYISLDGAFPILHGKNGEDGTVQGVLELAGIPVIGCNTMSSAIGMDKETAHKLAAAWGVKVADSVLISDQNNCGQALCYGRKLGYPLFVKPLRSGSSFGITKVAAEEELEEALKEAFRYDKDVVMEKAIEGFEVGCAILGTEELFLGEVDEIELSEGFFDYTEKYTLKTSNIHVPARITKEKAEAIKDTAAKIYRTLGCRCFARVDMFLTPEGEIYFNEVNTIPGFTAHSRYPNMMKAAGISFAELIERLMEQAVE